MEVTLDILGNLEPSVARTLLPRWLCGFLEVDADELAAAVAHVSEALNEFDDQALSESLAALRTIGDEYALYRADPVAQRVTRAFMRRLMAGSTVSGQANLLESHSAGPTLVVCNHLSYCDTQIKDLLLADNGSVMLADRLIAVAGPKVYETPFRRVASLALNTIKTAQSAALVHNKGALSPREIATIAIGTVRTAQEQMAAGDIVLLYGEGSRSRDQRLGPFIKAVRKYAQLEGCRIVPMALSGSDQMMPLEQMKMRPVPVQLRIGPSISVADLGPLGALEATWHAVASMLPPNQQPLAGTTAVV